MIERPYWWDTLPAGVNPAGSPFQASDRPRDLPQSTDVLVVGAGYTGLAAARRLALSGARVLTLDAEGIGWGASSRNGGQVLTGLRVDPATLVASYGEGRARELFAGAQRAIANLEALVASESIACEFERVGHLQAAWKPAHFGGFRDEQALLARVFNHTVTLVEPKDQRSEIGSDRYHGLMIDEASAALNPAQYVAGLASAAVRCGAQLLTGVRVTSLGRSGGGWIARTPSGDVAARDVLVATNGYTTAATPAVQCRFVPVGSYIVATRPLSKAQADAILPKRRMAFDSKHFLYYFRVTRDRRLLFGGRAEFTPPDPQSVRRAAAILRSGIAAVFPHLASVDVDYAWGGNVSFTRDELPHAGVLDGLHFAGGYGGHGIALATELGDLIARKISGAAVDHPLFALPCPAIPFYSGRPWFLPLAGAFYKVKDWIS